MARPPEEFARLNRIDLDAAKSIVAGEEGWLPPGEVMALLTAFGLPVLGGTLATTTEHAVAAQLAYDAPVALKAVADDLLHKSKGGGVELGVTDAGGVAEAFRAFQERFGDRLRGVFVQPMASGGRELLVGVVTDEKFGPLVVTGLGGVDTDLLDDRAAALAPLSTADADDLLHGFRAAGYVLMRRQRGRRQGSAAPGRRTGRRTARDRRARHQPPGADGHGMRGRRRTSARRTGPAHRPVPAPPAHHLTTRTRGEEP